MVRSRRLAEVTLPLFLEMEGRKPSTVAQVALALSAELHEIADTLQDMRQDLPDWVEFFRALVERE